jgi:hypothetical protein
MGGGIGEKVGGESGGASARMAANDHDLCYHIGIVLFKIQLKMIWK